MGLITATNKEGTLLSYVDLALTGAVNASAVKHFPTVEVASSDEQAGECMHKGDTPAAIIVLDGVEEVYGPDTALWVTVNLHLLIFDKQDPSIDRTTMMVNAMLWKNLALNAIQASYAGFKAANIDGWGDDQEYHPWLRVGEVTIVEDDDPWLKVHVPLAFAYHATTLTGR